MLEQAVQAESQAGQGTMKPAVHEPGRSMERMNPDLLRVIDVDFPQSQHEAVIMVLKRYGDQECHREHDRVRLAALRLADRSIEQLKQAIDVARVDYRDILAWAESPNEMDRMAGRNGMTSKEAGMADRAQMQEWLAAHGLTTQCGVVTDTRSRAGDSDAVTGKEHK